MTAEQDNPSGVRTDRPIRKLREDKLGRQGFARSIAAQIRNAPRGESFVMGLVGPWGSGKTSILNMVEDDLASDQNLLFLSFNPWLFSGHQQLVAHFFHEIAAQLRDEGGQELRDIWRGFEGYSRLLRPLRPVPGANNESHGETREPSVRRQRRELENALENTQYRLVIVIDDLDRLEDEEIQDVMRLVRLVADFPNTFYLLSYDQKRVEDALGGAGGAERGRAYLEKIVQIMHHVPELRPSDLTTILSSSLDAFLAKTHHLPAGNDYLLNVFYQGIRPLFQGMRDVYRYMNALEPTFKQIGDEIVSADILALEALRVLEPAVFMGIVDQIELVTGVQNPWLGAASRDEQQKQNASRDALFAIAGTRAPIIARLMTLLFPATRGHYGADSQGRWRKERRVAHPDVLRVYVERVLPTGALPTRTVQKFIDKQHEEQALMLHVESMSPTELEQQLQRLADYEEDIRPENAEVVIKVLLDQLPRLSGRRTTMYEIGPDTRLRWIIMGLLRKLDRSACLGIVERQLPRVKTLSLRGELLSIVNGNDEHRLINKIDLERLEKEFSQGVLHASLQQLASELDLILLLHRARRHDESGVIARIHELSKDDAGLMRLLTSGLSESFSNAMGSVVCSVERSLWYWDELNTIIGHEAFEARIRELDSRRNELILDARGVLALDTALRYLQGFRPKNDTLFKKSALTDSESSDVVDIDDEESDDLT